MIEVSGSSAPLFVGIVAAAVMLLVPLAVHGIFSLLVLRREVYWTGFALVVGAGPGHYLPDTFSAVVLGALIGFVVSATARDLSPDGYKPGPALVALLMAGAVLGVLAGRMLASSVPVWATTVTIMVVAIAAITYRHWPIPKTTER